TSARERSDPAARAVPAGAAAEAAPPVVAVARGEPSGAARCPEAGRPATAVAAVAPAPARSSPARHRCRATRSRPAHRRRWPARPAAAAGDAPAPPPPTRPRRAPGGPDGRRGALGAARPPHPSQTTPFRQWPEALAQRRQRLAGLALHGPAAVP